MVAIAHQSITDAWCA